MNKGSSAAGPGATSGGDTGCGECNGGPSATTMFCYKQGSPVLFGNQSIYNANGFGH